ncbi:hypothetical protein TNCV_1911991 [Trichonephila clavipes]|nr:hypothetical protein TNCV_1911991 [Trichonephila clavipes]
MLSHTDSSVVARLCGEDPWRKQPKRDGQMDSRLGLSQRMTGKHYLDHNAPSQDHSGNGCMVFYFRRLTPYAPTSIRPMEHKTGFIGKQSLSPLSGCPVSVLPCKFQPSLPKNSSQHNGMNQAFASTQKRLLNSSLGDTVGSPFVSLGGQLLSGLFI